MNARKVSARGLQDEVAALLDDLIALARDKTGLDSERLEELKQGFRERVGEWGSEATEVAQDAAANISDHAEEAFDRVDEYAHENPWQVVLVAGLIGLAAGVLLARR